MYVMHVDIKWISQRPHFLSAALSKTHRLYRIYQRANKRQSLSSNALSGFPLFRLPGRSLPLIAIVDRFLLVVQQFFYLIFIRPDVAIISAPDLFTPIFNWMKIDVTYDCMDDMLALAKTQSQLNIQRNAEVILVKNATAIFASSNHLADVLKTRYPFSENKISVVRNAFGGEILNIGYNQLKMEKISMGYFGTISNWFDLQLVEHFLNKNPGGAISLAGPLEIDLPKRKDIHYLGVLPHDKLVFFREISNVMVMPFVVNDLIRSVDPVKIYEYINLGLPIVSPYYEELDYYKGFLEFYSSPDEFIAAIQRGFSGRKYTESQRIAFLEQNTWQSRANAISNILKLSH